MTVISEFSQLGHEQSLMIYIVINVIRCRYCVVSSIALTLAGTIRSIEIHLASIIFCDSKCTWACYLHRHYNTPYHVSAIVFKFCLLRSCLHTDNHHHWKIIPFLSKAFLRRFPQSCPSFFTSFDFATATRLQNSVANFGPKPWLGWPSLSMYVPYAFYSRQGYSWGILTRVHDPYR
jgi:hypothetical protein